MKILLLGEYSNVHWTLGEGLKALGHDVTVVSDGDVWKGYPRDINLKRKSLGKIDTLKYLWDVKRLWPRLKDFDVVQIINPMFLDLMAERIEPYYQRLRQQNGKMVMGAYGIDYYWVMQGMKSDIFRYSDFYMYGQPRSNHDIDVMVSDWIDGYKGELNKRVANDCDAIVTGLYEYDVCYRPYFPQKTTFIPFPIHCDYTPTPKPDDGVIRFFIGIQKTRNEYKGTDIMLRALLKLQERYPDRMQIVKAESVPFEQYKEMMNSSHVLLDQLYSYTPGMNGLLAMSKGIVLVGGGEEEQYDIINEHELRPIINVQPTEEDVIHQIEHRILLHPENIKQLATDSIEYVRRHHDYIKVAQLYEYLYKSL